MNRSKLRATRHTLDTATRVTSGSVVAVLAMTIGTANQLAAANPAAGGRPPSSSDGAPQTVPTAAKRNARKGKRHDEPALSEIVITATGTNIAGVKPVGTVMTVISQKDMEQAGVENPSDIVRLLPQAQNLSELQQGGTTQQLTNGAQGTGIDLRGLGPQATLILVDGRRMVPSGGISSFTEADQVPLAALSRIEVITGGASAVYGSDAVAGVVNYIIRKDFKGVALSEHADNNSGSLNDDTDITAGTRWDAAGPLGAGNVLVSASFEHRDPYLAGNNPYLRQDMTPFGGVDSRINGSTASVGFAPNIVVQSAMPNTTLPRAGEYTYWGVPPGSGVGLTVSDLALNRPSLLDYSNYWDWTGKQNRRQAVLFFNQDLNDRVQVYAESYFYDRDTMSRYGISGEQSVTLPAFLTSAAGVPTTTPNPYYVRGIPGDTPGIPGLLPPDPLQVQYNTIKDIGPQIYAASARTYSITLGGTAILGDDWQGEAYYTYGRNTDCDYCVPGTNVDAAALQSQINQGLINPLSSQPLSAAQIATFVGSGELTSHSGMDDAVLKFNGPLFHLASGPVKAAVGAEWQHVYTENQNTDNSGPENAIQTFTTYASSRYGRDIRSAFAEAYVPIVGEGGDVPFMKSLTGSGSVRYDDYSDVGPSTSPKLGLSWSLDDHFSLEGTWGKSFRAPSVTDLNPQSYTSGIVLPLPNTNPAINNSFFIPGLGALTNAAVIFGANPNLKPERSTNWSLTGAFRSGGFAATASYYDIAYTNRISFPSIFVDFGSPLTPPPGYGGYGNLVVPIHNPATCTNSNINSADPALQPYLKNNILYTAGATVSSGSSLNSNFCQVNVLLDSRFQNLSSEHQKGIDIEAHYVKGIRQVILNAGGSATVVLVDDVQAAPGGPVLDMVGHSLGGDIVRWRARGYLGAIWDHLSATSFLNYVGPYTNDGAINSQGAVIGGVQVASFTTVDFNVAYGRQPSEGFLKKWQVSLTVSNAFDRQPPLFVTSGQVIDEFHSSPFGRTFSGQVTVEF